MLREGNNSLRPKALLLEVCTLPSSRLRCLSRTVVASWCRSKKIAMDYRRWVYTLLR